MKPYYFHSEALLEADEAAKFYEERQKSLGKRFIDTVTDTINRIRRHPKLYRKIDGNVRKCRLLHFPYGVIYRDKN